MNTLFKPATKKPVIVYAVQLTKENKDDIVKYIRSKGHNVTPATSYLQIMTLEGAMIANFDDYIIEGVQGEFYPCKPGIFEMTYSY